MTRDDVVIFLALFRGNSIKAAARELVVDTSTVSRRLASLESELETTLFERSFQGLVPTDAGLAIEPLARSIESTMEQIKSTALAACERLEGRVQIAASPVVLNNFLAAHLAGLRSTFPKVEFEISAGIGRVDVTRREADIAIRAHPEGSQPAEGSAIAKKVARFGLAAFASPGYLERAGTPQRPIRDLAGHKLIIAFRQSPGDLWNQKLEKPAEVGLVAFPYASMAAAAANDQGIAILPCLMGDQDSRLERLGEVLFSWNLWVVAGAQFRSNHRVSSVMDHILKLVESQESLFAGRD